MNLRFVEAFVWVARLHSASRTAEKLCLTQSAVSSRIAVLEEELGVPLIDRRDRLFRLTNAGARFLVYAERLINLQHELKRELGTPEGIPLSLRVGSIESVLHTWLIPMLESLKNQNQHIALELNVEMTHVLNEQLCRGGLDLAFTAAAASGQGIVNEALPPMEMALVGAMAMASTKKISIETIVTQELLTFQRGSQPHLALLNALNKAGITDKRVHAISSISALVKLVENGFGLATLPRVAAEELCKRHDIAVLKSQLPLAPLPLYASYWDSRATPALDEAISKALAFARKLSIRGEPQQ